MGGEGVKVCICACVHVCASICVWESGLGLVVSCERVREGVKRWQGGNNRYAGTA